MPGTGLFHAWQHPAGAVKNPRNIGIEQFLPLRNGNILAKTKISQTGIVDEHIHRPVFFQNDVEGSIHLLQIAYICRQTSVIGVLCAAAIPANSINHGAFVQKLVYTL